MKKHDYAVVIRTLGNGGAKYKKLIDSIRTQTVQPSEIIVVLPFGYQLDYSLGNEKLIFSEKGMVIQRVTGMLNATTEYILVVDDDIEFKSDFTAKLFNCATETNADLISPSNGEIEKWNMSQRNSLKKNINIIKHVLLGNRFLHLDNKYAIKIVGTGGHSILNRFESDRFYLTQSGNFQCFFAKTESAKAVHLEDEKWLEEVGYAILDDQVFFYKAFLQKQKVVFAPNIRYLHLDGGKGHTNKKNEEERLYKKLYSNMRNRTIFWRLFLYNNASLLKKTMLKLCYVYVFINTVLIYVGGSMFNISRCRTIIKAIKDGSNAGFNHKL